MTRNYPRYDARNIDAGEAAGRETDVQVMSAIDAVSAMSGRNITAVWEAPTPAEFDHVAMCLNEWARLGDIAPGAYQWGEETIAAEAA